MEIVRLQQLVKALALQAEKDACRVDAKKMRFLDGAAGTGKEDLGFTDAVLTIIRTSDEALTARGVRDRTVELGYQLGRYSNPLDGSPMRTVRVAGERHQLLVGNHSSR